MQLPGGSGRRRARIRGARHTPAIIGARRQALGRQLVSVRSPRAGLGAVLALAVVATLGAWLALDALRSAPRRQSQGPSLISPRELAKLSDSLELGIHWAGERPGFRLELTQTDDRVYLRYLPPGVKVGDRRPAFLTVGTYAQDNAYANVQAASRRRGAVSARLAGGTLAVYDRERPTSVYLSYPGADYQVEVYHPDVPTVRRLVASGRVTGSVARQTKPVPFEARRGELRDLAAFLRVPIHWAGARDGFRYETTVSSEGGVFVRYLPRGVAVGDRRPRFLTVATYRQRNGWAALRAATRRASTVSLDLARGGLAVYDRGRPTSVYLSYPGADYQVEVYHADAATARRLVLSGQVRSVS
jgi:hypothetical protein